MAYETRMHRSRYTTTPPPPRIRQIRERQRGGILTQSIILFLLQGARLGSDVFCVTLSHPRYTYMHEYQLHEESERAEQLDFSFPRLFFFLPLTLHLI